MGAYPDSPGGLKKLIKDILSATQANDHKRVTSFLDSLLVPDDAWFTAVFGKEKGPQLAGWYEARRIGIASGLSEEFVELVRQKMTEVAVRRFRVACDQDANEYEYPMLAARQIEYPLYEVRLAREGSGKTFWFFAYIEGGFRFLGNLNLYPRVGETGDIPNPPAESGKRRQLVDAKIQEAKLIRHDPPAYPARADRLSIQGTVRLLAVVGIDGRIRNTELIQGHCWLAEAAVDAVQKWRYSPTLVNGEPVEVVTTIDIVFSAPGKL